MERKEEETLESMINISYLGISDDTITPQLIQLAESYLNKSDDLKGLTKKVPFLIAESFQNVIRHGGDSVNELETSRTKDFFQIEFLTDRVILCAANWIKNDNAVLLNKRIDEINELSPEDLKSLWKTIITSEDFTSKGGAGLGIIEMARKSSAPIRKKFIEYDEGKSLFFLGLEIIKKSDSTVSNFDISKSEKQYNRFVNDGVLLQYNGHFNEEINSSLIEILEKNFVEPNNMSSDAAENMTMIIEIIQNASKHGMLLNDVKEGTFSIHGVDDELIVGCSNYICPKEYDEFKQFLDGTKAMNLTELKAEQKRVMLEEALTESGNGGLGILEIAIYSQNTFEYSFRKLSDNRYFYTIEIKLIK